MSTNVDRLASEQIVVQAPMSFAGSAARCRRIVWRNADNAMVKIAVWGFLLPAWWLLVLAWYLTFGIALIPYRMIRKGQRRRRLEEARHREQLAAFTGTQKPAAPSEDETAGQ